MLLTTALALAPVVSEPLGPFLGPLEPLVAPPQARAMPGRGESEYMLSWKFLEVHAQQREVHVLDEDVQGFGARGAWQFGQGFFARFGADLYSEDEVDVWRYDAGIGQALPLQNGLDAFASVSWVLEDFDGAAADYDADGYRVELGLRGALDQRLESEARLGYEDVVDDGFIFGADVRYWFADQVALGIGFEREVDDDVWTLGLRYAF
jgi:hypothetical protein